MIAIYINFETQIDETTEGKLESIGGYEVGCNDGDNRGSFVGQQIGAAEVDPFAIDELRFVERVMAAARIVVGQQRAGFAEAGGLADHLQQGGFAGFFLFLFFDCLSRTDHNRSAVLHRQGAGKTEFAEPIQHA